MHSQLEDEIKEYFKINMDCRAPIYIVWDTMKAVFLEKIMALTLSYKKGRNAEKTYCIILKSLRNNTKTLGVIRFTRLYWWKGKKK